jgi:hypothetical protein
MNDNLKALEQFFICHCEPSGFDDGVAISLLGTQKSRAIASPSLAMTKWYL